MILKHRDRNILRFEWLEPYGTRVLEVFEENLKFLPLEMKGEATDDALWSWLKHRIAPCSRWNIMSLYSVTRCRFRSVRDVISRSLGLSLIDVFWVVEDDFDGQWCEYSLYRNNFSKGISDWTLFENSKYNLRRKSFLSPEFTTHGMLPKCWIRKGSVISLLKAGHEYKGLQPYSEFYAAQIAKAMGIRHVEYGLSQRKNILCSTCKLFTSEDIGFAPAWSVATREEAYSDLRFSNMFLFDSIIGNIDRHLGNFGYLVDNNTNEVIDTCPIFDNGQSLFAVKKSLLNTIRMPLNVSVLQRSMLESLENFRFKRHPRYNMPVDALRAIEDLIHNRVARLIKMSRKAA